MNYTRLFHQRVKTRPWSGLKQLPHWWRSVIHTCRNAKISSNVTFFYLRIQPGFALRMRQMVSIRQHSWQLGIGRCGDGGNWTFALWPLFSSLCPHVFVSYFLD